MQNEYFLLSLNKELADEKMESKLYKTGIVKI